MAASMKWGWASRPCGSRTATTGCCILAAIRGRIDGLEWRAPPMAFAGKNCRRSLKGSQPWDSQVICDPTIELLDGRLTVWFGGGDAPSPDENLNGQIGVATLHAVDAGNKLAK